ncbi:phage baseplate assembly protein V [Paraburkholderia sp. BR10936]|uniref:phage baseplate assembly protein V n=1 Tax=Paraburkholderia sp. BR10936 TaxID=3236993 RepID=UPI0034D1565D
MSREAYNALSEMARKLAQVVSWGVVTDIDLESDPPLIKCDCGGYGTDWVKWFAVRGGETRKWSPPTIGEEAVVFAPAGKSGTGFALVGFYGEGDAPSNSPDVEMTLYPDGSTVAYDHAAHVLTVDVGSGSVVVNCNVATVKAADSVTLDTPKTHMTGDLVVDGNATVTKNLGVTGGMAVQGEGTDGAVSTFAGSIRLTNGDISADGHTLKGHKHPDPQGGETDVGVG